MKGTTVTTVGVVIQLNRFPVKSMQGESPVEVDLDEDGIVGDRIWALRDVATGKLVSAKQPRLWRKALDCTATGAGSDVSVALPDGSRFTIDDPELLAACSSLFGRDVVLEAAEHTQQGVYASDWPDVDGLTLSGEIDFPTNLLGTGTRFVDVEALHLITTASLGGLAGSADGLDVDSRRFRPSLVIETPTDDEFVENGWQGQTLSIGDAEITVGIPTPRCVMTTLEQPGLDREPAMLKALALVNRQENKLGTFACLGAYAQVNRIGSVRVGDEVRIL